MLADAIAPLIGGGEMGQSVRDTDWSDTPLGAGFASVGNGHLEGGMELLTKPFSMDALAAKVGIMLKASEAS